MSRRRREPKPVTVELRKLERTREGVPQRAVHARLRLKAGAPAGSRAQLRSAQQPVSTTGDTLDIPHIVALQLLISSA